MMEKETSTGRSLLRALYLLPLVCICLAVNAKTKVNYVYDNSNTDQTTKKVVGRVTLDYDTLKYEGTLKYENMNPGTDINWDVEAYKLPEGKTVDELIKTLPGVGYDEDGNITVNGKPVSKVLVNGKAYNRMDIDELISAIPGVEVDDNSTIKVNGRAVSRVLVNGEELK